MSGICDLCATILPPRETENECEDMGRSWPSANRTTGLMDDLVASSQNTTHHHAITISGVLSLHCCIHSCNMSVFASPGEGCNHSSRPVDQSRCRVDGLDQQHLAPHLELDHLPGRTMVLQHLQEHAVALVHSGVLPALACTSTRPHTTSTSKC
jgi:hypothetical protein